MENQLSFKQKAVKYLKDHGIEVTRTEQQGDVESIACHISRNDNDKVDSIQKQMEQDLGVVVMRSDFYGMNVVIVEGDVE